MKKKGKKMISHDDVELQKFKEIAKTIPDIRVDKIEIIKEQIKSGKYIVNGKEVVKKILEHGCEINHITHQKKKSCEK
ncbi:MAG: flagellar biosynthesis anti-sigma factor FlgM [bacterium]